MLQEDSNGEASFEIIDKKVGDMSNNGDKTESLSSISSSAYSIPSPSVVNAPGGNLLSNVAPPSSLPDFTLWPTPAVASVAPTVVPPTFTSSSPSITSENVAPQVSTAIPYNPMPLQGNQFPTTQFSAAIPPSKGIQHGPIPENIHSENDNSVAGLMGFVKEAFSSGGVLSKMAEKAKSSVDSIITTLDPQMSEYIYSGGDIELTVASENDEEVAPIREAFHSVFGKAWVNGIKLNVPPKRKVTIGFDEAVKEANTKIEQSLVLRKTPTVAVESFLLEKNNEWYDLSVLVLRDAEKQITVKTFTQATPVPVDQYLKQIEKERPDYKDFNVEEKLASYLQTRPGWQQTVSGVSRKEVLLLAAKTLVRIYKDKITVSN